MALNVQTRFTTAEALRIGDLLGVDWSRIGLEEFRRGIEFEMERSRRAIINATNDDPVVTAKIVLGHLERNPHHYSHAAMVGSAR